MNPHIIRLVMWGGGVMLVGLLLFVSGLLMFGPPAEKERDHRPPGRASGTHEPR
jgi:hypothetical protein